MALSAAQWDAIQTEYQAGAFVRALARQHGVHESSIRQKAREQNWTRDPQAAERIRRANQPGGLPGMAARYVHPAPRHSTSSRTAGSAPGAVPEEVTQADAVGMAASVRAMAAARAAGGNVAADARARVIARVSLEQLARAERIGRHFDALVDLLLDALQPSEDEAGRWRQAEARKVLLSKRRDSLVSYIKLAGELLLQIESTTQKALELNALQELPAAAGETAVLPRPAASFDLSRLTPEQRAEVDKANRLCETMGRPRKPGAAEACQSQVG
jgi:hypothetical protein